MGSPVKKLRPRWDVGTLGRASSFFNVFNNLRVSQPNRDVPTFCHGTAEQLNSFQ
jgi:hypothetical protein